jgi:hypothetical protein
MSMYSYPRLALLLTTSGRAGVGARGHGGTRNGTMEFIRMMVNIRRIYVIDM